MAITLEKNYDIQLTRNDAVIADQNNTLGNAGFLPTLDLSMTGSKAITNSKQQFYDGRTREASNASNNSLNALAELNWTVFDGMKMWVSKKSLEELERQGMLNVRLQVENTYLALATLYYELVQQQKLLEVLKISMQVSRSRSNLAQRKFQLGSASEVDLIQARVDMSADSTLLIKQYVVIKNLKADINTVLGRSPSLDFAARRDIQLDENVDYISMQEATENQNIALMLARSQMKINELQVEENKAYFYPWASVYGNYSYTRSKSEVGLLESNQSNGPSFGFRINYNLFNGMNDKRILENSKIEYQSSGLRVDQVMNNNESDLYKAYNRYTGAIQEVLLERTTVQDTRQNLKIAIELYKAGSINEIDFREIQRTALDAENRLLTAEYLAKIAELEMKQISGQLQI